jgi:hypothetical protein
MNASIQKVNHDHHLQTPVRSHAPVFRYLLAVLCVFGWILDLGEIGGKMTDKQLAEKEEVGIIITLFDYIGDTCKYCHKGFFTLEDLQSAVIADGETRSDRIAHKSCWDENHDRQTTCRDRVPRPACH